MTQNLVKEQNSKIYLTADTHFFHKNIIDYCNRPFSSLEKMNELMIFYWNEIVKSKDIVIHCGDFSMGGAKQFEELIYRLNGKIFLIRGNHDRQKSFYEKYSEKIVILPHKYKIDIMGKQKIKGIIFSHKPLSLNEIPDNFINCHGHLHSNIKNKKDNHFPHIDVGVDMFNYQPIKLSTLLSLKLEEI